MLKNYGGPKDFASFLYASQVLQAEGIKIGAEHLRRNRPRIMGSIFWQLNDCWPVASWSSIDYFGRWKALQYYARRFYSPLLVSPHVEDGALRVYVVSDKTTPASAQLRLRIMKMDGTVLSDNTQEIEVPALSSKVYLQKLLAEFVNREGTDAATIFGVTDLLVEGKQVSRNVTYFLPTKEIHLPEAQIVAELTGKSGTYKLHLSAKALARSVYVSFGDADFQLSDNYFDLIPGEGVDIGVTSSASVEELKAKLKVISLADAFSAAGTTPQAPER
jgi:beta-mannosidase